MPPTPAPSARRALIVEDDPEVRRLLRRLLADVVAEFTECDNGSEAHAAFERCQPDVVLMDMSLPGLDGIGAAQQIRSAHPTALIVIVTNHDQGALRRAAAEAGVAAFILKDNLLEVRTLLQGHFAS